MLSRRKEPPKKRDDDGPSSSSSSTSAKNSKTTLSSNTKTPTAAAAAATVPSRGEKRKSADSNPHDKEGSEYLRRKHNFIKSTIRVDYQPDICKDYKETGFCGFGDSCKFLHDRTDYKHGWQLDQEYAKGQYKDEEDDKYLIKDSDEEDEDGGEDETRCKICEEPYKDPIVTKCKHHFCDACAERECLDKCFVCQKPTSGIFKPAKLDLTTNKATKKS